MEKGAGFVIIFVLFGLIFLLPSVFAAGCADPAQTILKLSGATNAHAELAGQNHYSYSICYNDVFPGKTWSGTAGTCSGTAIIVKLSGATNAHAELPTKTNYGTNVCYGDLIFATSTYGGDCSDFGSTYKELVQISGDTNAHLAMPGTTGANAYPTKICVRSPSAETVPQYALAVTKDGTGTGTVSSNPAGISCGSTCSYSYNSGQSVTLTATADSGSTFTSWSGDCSGTSPTCTVTMSAAKSAKATFNNIGPPKPTAPTNVVANTGPGCGGVIVVSWNSVSAATNYIVSRYNVSTNKWINVSFGTITSFTNTGLSPGTRYDYIVFANNSAGSSSPSAQVNNIASGVCIAVPATPGTPTVATSASCGGKIDISWNSVSGATGYNISRSTTGTAGTFNLIGTSLTTSYADTGLTPGSTYYYEIAAYNSVGSSAYSNAASNTASNACMVKYRLTVTKAGTGTGTVISSPLGINCGTGAGCYADFDQNSDVTLSANVDTGSVFSGWSGPGINCPGTGTCTVNMGTATKAVTATFTPVPPAINKVNWTNAADGIIDNTNVKVGDTVYLRAETTAVNSVNYYVYEHDPAPFGDTTVRTGLTANTDGSGVARYSWVISCTTTHCTDLGNTCIGDICSEGNFLELHFNAGATGATSLNSGVLNLDLTQTPDGPSSVKVNVGSCFSGADSTVSISWDAVPGANSYYVYTKNAGTGAYTQIGKDILTASFTPTVVAGQVVTYAVSANLGPESVKKDADQITVPTSVCSNPPSPVTSLTANPGPDCDGQINVTWVPVNGAESYIINRSVAGGAWGIVATIAQGASPMNFTDSLAVNKQASYNIIAQNAAGKAAQSSIVSATSTSACTTLTAVWKNMHNELLFNSYIGADVQMIGTNFPANSKVNFTLKDKHTGLIGRSDGTIKDNLPVITDNNGMANYTWHITQHDLDLAASGDGDGYREFYFDAILDSNTNTKATSQILNVSNYTSNRNPYAIIVKPIAGIYFVNAPIEFTEDSYDVDGRIVNINWSIGATLSNDQKTAHTFNYSYATPGQKEIKLEVTDDDGGKGLDIMDILVINKNETASAFINEPANFAHIPNQTVNYDGQGSYIINVTGTGPTLSDWHISCLGGNCPDHTVGCPDIVAPANCPANGIGIDITKKGDYSALWYAWKFTSDPDANLIEGMGRLNGSHIYPPSSLGQNPNRIDLRVELFGKSSINSSTYRMFYLIDNSCDRTKGIYWEADPSSPLGGEEIDTSKVPDSCNKVGCCQYGLECVKSNGVNYFCKECPIYTYDEGDQTSIPITSCYDYNKLNLDWQQKRDLCNADCPGAIVETLKNNPNIPLGYVAVGQKCAWINTTGSETGSEQGSCGVSYKLSDHDGPYCPPTNPSCTKSLCLPVDRVISEGECGIDGTRKLVIMRNNSISVGNSYQIIPAPAGTGEECSGLIEMNVPCGKPSIELPFFNGVTFIMTLIAITIIYSFLIRKKHFRKR